MTLTSFTRATVFSKTAVISVALSIDASPSVDVPNVLAEPDRATRVQHGTSPSKSPVAARFVLSCNTPSSRAVVIGFVTLTWFAKVSAWALLRLEGSGLYATAGAGGASAAGSGETSSR